MLDTQKVKKNFPIFEKYPKLVYLDSAATALKPKSVVEAMDEYYFEYSANIARGLYPLAERATTAVEKVRQDVARFIHAESRETVVFTANATHAINLVALGLEETVDEKTNIIVTDLEHHSNYLPWKDLAQRTKAQLRSTSFTVEGVIDIEALATQVDSHTAVVAFSAVSNVFGVSNPVEKIVQIIRRKNKDVLILVDACQAVGHYPVDTRTWDADFVVFSGHKLLGPTGVGVLVGKKVSLEKLIPKNVGGGTVLDACSPQTEYRKLPENLEGGTPNIAGIIGLGAAIDYIERLGLDSIHQSERELMRYTLDSLQKAFGEKIHILGTSESKKRSGLVSFTLDGIHPHDLAYILGEENVCVRAGTHCATPLHQVLGVPATTRVSLSIYNSKEDIDALIAGIKKALTVFV